MIKCPLTRRCIFIFRLIFCCAVIPSLPPAHAQSEKGVEDMDICAPELGTLNDEVVTCNISQVNPAANFVTGRPLQATYCSVQSKRYQEIGRFEMRCENSEQLRCKDGFSCVISMHDGVVMYATSSLTTTLGFPKDMWIGRSFIDFVHPRDRNTFASQITNGLAVPKIDNGTQEKGKLNYLNLLCQFTVLRPFCDIMFFLHLLGTTVYFLFLYTFLPS